MNRTTGDSLRNRALRLFQTSAAAETIFLILLGAGAVALHAALRLPVKLPGHKGVLYIGMLMIGRLITTRPWSASTASASAGAVSLIPVLGFKDPLDPLTFFLAGLLIDVGFRYVRVDGRSIWSVALFGAVAYATKPLARSLYLPLTGTAYPSLINGILYPLGLHLLFGASGAVAAALLLSIVRRSKTDG